MKWLLFAASLLLFISCGTSSSSRASSEEDQLQVIRDRLNENACRINREDLVFQLGELEYLGDTTFVELPLDLLPDSLCHCPVTGENYIMVVDGNDRRIDCPAGHGDTEF